MSGRPKQFDPLEINEQLIVELYHFLAFRSFAQYLVPVISQKHRFCRFLPVQGYDKTDLAHEWDERTPGWSEGTLRRVGGTKGIL